MGAKHNYVFVKEFFEELCSDLKETFELQYCEDTIVSFGKHAIITISTEHMKILFKIKRTSKYFYITPLIIVKDKVIVDKNFRERNVEDSLEEIADYVYDLLDSYINYGELPKNQVKKRT